MTASLRAVIIESYEDSCPIMVRHMDKNVPWWSGELANMRSKVRTLFSSAEEDGS